MTDLALTVFDALQAAGVPNDKAKAVAESIKESIRESVHERNLVTKADLEAAKSELIKWYVGIAMAQVAAFVFLIARVLGKA